MTRFGGDTFGLRKESIAFFCQTSYYEKNFKHTKKLNWLYSGNS